MILYQVADAANTSCTTLWAGSLSFWTSLLSHITWWTHPPILNDLWLPVLDLWQSQACFCNQSINQSINLYRAMRVLQCGYAESKRNVLRQILNVLTDGAVRQFSGREFQSLGAATEKRWAAVSKLCGGTDRSFDGCVCMVRWPAVPIKLKARLPSLTIQRILNTWVIENSLKYTCRKLSKEMKFWRSYCKNKTVQFFASRGSTTNNVAQYYY